MRSISKKLLVLAPVLVLAAACGGKEEAKPVDAALSNDLALAAQAQPYMPQQFMSPMEQGMQPYYGQPGYGMPQGYYPQAQPQQVVYRAPTAHRTATRATTGTVARRPVVVQRNTRRDAIIGAVGGAAIGAVTSRDKVKGAVIGGALGGVAGAIIGQTIDVKRQ